VRKKLSLQWGHLLAASSLLSMMAVSIAAVAQGPYHVTAQWKVGGDGGWDYLAVDPASRLLYVTHGDHVIVIDTNSGTMKADITRLKGTHGVVFDTSGKYGYISSGGADEVVVFDRKTDAILQRVPAGTNPDGIVFEPVTQTVWAFNGRSHNATVIDDATHKVIATVPLPGKPEFPVADGKGSIYDNIEDLSEIVHIDAKTHTVVAAWPLAPCESPSGLAIDRKHDRLFSVCDNNKMAVVDAATGKVVATPAIGDGPDAARFDAKHQLAISSNGEGTLTFVHEDSPDSYSAVQTLPTKRGARTMALDEASGKVYVVTADFGPRPAATPDHPRPRPSMIPGSFVVIQVSR
jgi:DNA-binding beta-propeller fold protein YncE